MYPSIFETSESKQPKPEAEIHKSEIPKPLRLCSIQIIVPIIIVGEENVPPGTVRGFNLDPSGGMGYYGVGGGLMVRRGHAPNPLPLLSN